MKNPRLLFLVLISLLSLLLATTTGAQPKATTPAQQLGVTAEMKSQANDFYQRRDWANAAEAYETITRLEPSNAGAWARRGLALHSLGKYREAIEAGERSLSLNDQQPMTHFNLARSHARLNESDKAFASLKGAVEAGFSQVELLNAETDFTPLRDDPRFKELATRASVNARPCAARPEYRQLDYWIGEWDVKGAAQNQVAGASSIQLILGDCIIFENWTGAGGTNGKSFSFFNSETGQWRQTWVDDKGGLLEFTGFFKDGAMHFTAPATFKGRKALQRMTLFNISPAQMRQLGEQSTDEGKTWSVIYDLIYNRRK
jgi:tetratricopeptide (TPR) repeat protein